MFLLASGCEGQEPQAAAPTPQASALEAAAVEAGLIPDISRLDLAGSFERSSDLGTDKFCAVGTRENGYQIGVLAVFGPDSKCEGQGEAQIDGETIRIALNSEKSCRFTARFDGVSLQLPGSLPAECSSYCSDRGALSGVSFSRVGEGDGAARATQGRDIARLCPNS